MKKICLSLLCLGLTACAASGGRVPYPEPTVQSGDNLLTCKDIARKYEFNTAKAEGAIKRNNKSDEDEFPSFFLYGPIAGNALLDTNNADGVEGNALIDRNLHLLKLANNKSCDTKDWPEQPNRYF